MDFKLCLIFIVFVMFMVVGLKAFFLYEKLVKTETTLSKKEDDIFWLQKKIESLKEECSCADILVSDLEKKLEEKVANADSIVRVRSIPMNFDTADVTIDIPREIVDDVDISSMLEEYMSEKLWKKACDHLDIKTEYDPMSASYILHARTFIAFGKDEEHEEVDWSR